MSEYAARVPSVMFHTSRTDGLLQNASGAVGGSSTSAYFDSTFHASLGMLLLLLLLLLSLLLDPKSCDSNVLLDSTSE